MPAAGRGVGVCQFCYDVLLFIVLLRRFICVQMIQTGKTYSIR